MSVTKKYLSFLESIKTSENKTVIEASQQAFKMLFEGDLTDDDLRRGEELYQRRVPIVTADGYTQYTPSGVTFTRAEMQRILKAMNRRFFIATFPHFPYGSEIWLKPRKAGDVVPEWDPKYGGTRI